MRKKMVKPHYHCPACRSVISVKKMYCKQCEKDLELVITENTLGNKFISVLRFKYPHSVAVKRRYI